MKPAFILTGNTFTGIVKGRPFTINSKHPKFAAVKTAWGKRDYKTLESIVDSVRAIESFSVGNLSVKHGVLTYRGAVISNKLADRIFEMISLGLDYNPLARFLDNLMQNPLESARNELFLFLSQGRMPITEDGHFLAYRKVDSEFKSYNANPDGTHNTNLPGEVVTMARELCDPNRHETCSRGLHFCSFSYLGQYHGGGGKVVIVSINPRDVVAIPSDYDNAKGRCCRYEVICEHTPGEQEDTLQGALALVKEEYEEGQTLTGRAKKFVAAIFGRKK